MGVRAILKRLLRSDAPPYFVRALKDRFPGTEVGTGTYGNVYVYDYEATSRLKIGSFTSLAANVTFLLGGNHRPDFVTTYPFNRVWDGFEAIQGHPASKGDIVVGSDVWIGRDAMIMSGVTIGDGAVIAARSVVTKDVEPYSIVAGQPARHRRYRFDARTIERLKEIEWWNWPEERIRKAVPHLMNTDIEGFLAKVDSGEL